MIRILAAIIVIDIKLYFRNFAAAFWTLLFPFMLLFFMLTAFGRSGQLGAVNVVIADEDSSAESIGYVLSLGQLLHRIDAIDYHIVRSSPADQSKTNTIVLQIPGGFGQATRDHRTAQVQLAASGDDALLLRTATSILLSVNDRLNISSGRSPELVTMALGKINFTRENLSYPEYLVSGIIVMVTFSTCLFGFTLPIVNYRRNGFLKVINILPTPRWLFLVGFVSSRVFIATAYAAFFLIAASLICGIDLHRPVHAYVLAASVLAVGIVAFLAIGFLVSMIAPLPATATVMCNAIYFCLMFVGDLFIPTRNFPKTLEPVISSFPLHVMVEELRRDLFEGGLSGSPGFSMATLAAWGAVAMLLAASVSYFKTIGRPGIPEGQLAGE